MVTASRYIASPATVGIITSMAPASAVDKASHRQNVIAGDGLDRHVDCTASAVDKATHRQNVIACDGWYHHVDGTVP